MDSRRCGSSFIVFGIMYYCTDGLGIRGCFNRECAYLRAKAGTRGVAIIPSAFRVPSRSTPIGAEGRGVGEYPFAPRREQLRARVRKATSGRPAPYRGAGDAHRRGAAVSGPSTRIKVRGGGFLLKTGFSETRPLIDVGPSADSSGGRIVVAAAPYAHSPLADLRHQQGCRGTFPFDSSFVDGPAGCYPNGDLVII